MNPELYLIIMPALGLILFALGGTQISDTIKGQKWLRRFLLPFLWGLVVLGAGFAWFQACAVVIVSCALFHLGYGSKTPWGAKLAVFVGYGAISPPIGISTWNLITIASAICLFLLSNFKPTSGTVVHKVWETITGTVIGISLGYLLAGYGLTWKA